MSSSDSEHDEVESAKISAMQRLEKQAERDKKRKEAMQIMDVASNRSALQIFEAVGGSVDDQARADVSSLALAQASRRHLMGYRHSSVAGSGDSVSSLEENDPTTTSGLHDVSVGSILNEESAR